MKRKKEIEHVHGNFKIKLVKFLSRQFTSVFFFIFKIFFPKVKSSSNEILISRATYAPWKIDIKFREILKKVNNLTLLDNPRLYTFFFLSKQISKLKGDILDIGCMKGGVGILLSIMNKKERVMLFDTFEGFLDKENLHKNNVFKFEGLNELNKIIKSYKLKNTFVYKRYFPNKVKNLNISKIKLCHIDVNTYVSTKKCFYYVKNKIVKNGIIIFDDYGIHGVEKVTNFIDKLIKKEKGNFIFIQNYFGQCILLKK
jgi:O-methyltransferase